MEKPEIRTNGLIIHVHSCHERMRVRCRQAEVAACQDQPSLENIQEDARSDMQ